MKLVASPWLPDQPAIGNPGLIRAENVIPAAEHYRSFPSASMLSLTGLSGQAEGMTVARPRTGEPVLFAAFGGFLWRVPGLATPLINVSQNESLGYTMNEGDRWRFVQYGQDLLATNLNDTVQRFGLTNLGGNFADLSGAPKAKFMARIHGFVVLGYINEEPDGLVPSRLRWHGFNEASGLPDPTEWTISLSTRSDFQDVADIGEMTGLTGGDFGIALFRTGLVRVDFGGQLLFGTSVVDDSIGCSVPGSVVRYGAETYFWSDEGIFKTAGGPAAPVGTERVNRYLRDNLDQSRYDDVWAYPDYRRGIIAWLLPTSQNASRLLIYRPIVDQFSTVEVDVDSLGPIISFGLDLDDETQFPDLDTDPRNLDDPDLWTSGLLGLGAQIESTDEAYDDYDADAADLVIFDGQPLEGLLEWSEMEPADGQRFMLNRGMVYHERGTAQLTIRSREQVPDDLTVIGPCSAQSDGFYRFRAPGRFHRVRVTMTDDWASIRGVDVDGAPLGGR